MKILSNRVTAILLCIVMILAGIYLGGRSPLMKLRDSALNVFYQGENNDGLGINYDLEKRTGLASNLTVVGKRYLNENDRKITDILAAVESIKTAGNPSEKFKANSMLTRTCDTLYDYLTSITLEGEDLRYTVNIKTDLDSRNMIIDHAGYNEKAKEFNNMLNHFPTNLVSIYCSVKPLELFE